MKTLSSLFGILWLSATVCPAVSTAQPCGSVVNCSPNHEYPYRFCKTSGSGYDEICTNDPLNVPGRTVLKNTFPLCAILTRNQDMPGDITAINTSNQDVIVFDDSEIENILSEAVEAWNCICGETRSNEMIVAQKSCCVKVVFSRNPDNINGSASSELATTVGTTYCPYGQLNCKAEGGPIVESRARIYVNNTVDFRGNLAGGTRKALFTDVTKPPALVNAPVLFSFRTLILHELGHWMGLFHPDKETPPGSGKYKSVCGNPPRDIDGCMAQKVTGNADSKPLHNDDKCAFMKLYCPTLTSVKLDRAEQLQHRGEKAVVATQFLLKNLTCQDIEVRLWSLAGHYLGDIRYEGYGSEIPLDLTQYIGTTVIVEVRCLGIDVPADKLHIIQVTGQ